MDQDERLIIIESIGIVDKALISLDFDKTQRLTLTNLSKQYGTKYDLYFANGGDQNNKNIPETNICKEYNIKLLDGLGDKIQSSSWLLNKY